MAKIEMVRIEKESRKRKEKCEALYNIIIKAFSPNIPTTYIRTQVKTNISQ